MHSGLSLSTGNASFINPRITLDYHAHNLPLGLNQIQPDSQLTNCSKRYLNSSAECIPMP